MLPAVSRFPGLRRTLPPDRRCPLKIRKSVKLTIFTLFRRFLVRITTAVTPARVNASFASIPVCTSSHAEPREGTIAAAGQPGGQRGPWRSTGTSRIAALGSTSNLVVGTNDLAVGPRHPHFRVHASLSHSDSTRQPGAACGGCLGSQAPCVSRSCCSEIVSCRSFHAEKNLGPALRTRGARQSATDQAG